MKRICPRSNRGPVGVALLWSLFALVCACSSPGQSLYEVASKGDSRKDAIRLMKRGGNVNEVDPINGWTPLHVAAAEGHPKMCDALIQSGANVNARDHNGMTPLHLAMANGHSKVVGVLLAGGADGSIKNNQGRTPEEMVSR